MGVFEEKMHLLFVDFFIFVMFSFEILMSATFVDIIVFVVLLWGPNDVSLS